MCPASRLAGGPHWASPRACILSGASEKGGGKQWGRLPHVCPKERTESATAFPAVISCHTSFPRLGPRLSQVHRNLCHFLAGHLDYLSLCFCGSNKELLITTIFYARLLGTAAHRPPQPHLLLSNGGGSGREEELRRANLGKGSARGDGKGPLHLGSNFINSVCPPPPPGPTTKPHTQCTYRTQKGDVKGIAQEAKGNREKAPRNRGVEEGVSDGLGGVDRGEQG